MAKALFLFFLSFMASMESRAAVFLYRFDGVVSGASGEGSEVFETEHGIIPGMTTVTYFFEVDFDRDTGAFTTPVQTVEYFFCELRGEGLASGLLGSISDQEAYEGNNIDFSNFRDTGQLRGGNVVTIFTTELVTPLWRVEDWKLGDGFQFTDLTRPVGSTSSVWLYGNATLSSIESIPETSNGLLSLVIGGLLLPRRRRVSFNNQPRVI